MSNTPRTDKETIWATSTTGDDFRCVHVDSMKELEEDYQQLEARIAELEKQLSTTIGERNEALISLEKYQNALDRFGLSADSKPQFQQASVGSVNPAGAISPHKKKVED